MVFVVVVVVEFERWSGPVDGFGCTRLNSGVQLCCFCVCVCISTVLAMPCKKNFRNVRGTNSFEVKTDNVCISNSGSEKQQKRKGGQFI